MANDQKRTVSTRAIPTKWAGTIEAHVFEPPPPLEVDSADNTVADNPAANAGPQNAQAQDDHIRGTIVTVHPWSTLGGGEHNTIGLARYLSDPSFNPRLPNDDSNNTKNCEHVPIRKGWRVITFTLRSTPIWKGGALWGICSAHSHEVQQIVDVVQWATRTYGSSSTNSSKFSESSKPIVLLGSSAGAPMAGSAMAQILKQRLNEGGSSSQNRCDDVLSAYIAIGYTFGNFASLGFGRHFSSVVESNVSSSSSLFSSVCGNASSTSQSSINTPPRLFIMGESDEFTTVDQLQKMVSKMKGGSGDANGSGSIVVDVNIVPKIGHFELESPRYDPLVAQLVMEWLEKIL